MFTLKNVVILALAAVSSAVPAGIRLTEKQVRYHEVSKRQNEAAAALGLNDFDILQL